MDQTVAHRLLTEQVRPVFNMLTQRQGHSLSDVLDALTGFDAFLQSLPIVCEWLDTTSHLGYRDIRDQVSESWPELGFYNEVSGSSDLTSGENIGDALDDLSDIALDIGRALELAEISPVFALNRMRFWYSTHLDEHILGVSRHLQWLLRQNAG